MSNTMLTDCIVQIRVEKKKSVYSIDIISTAWHLRKITSKMTDCYLT